VAKLVRRAVKSGDRHAELILSGRCYRWSGEAKHISRAVNYSHTIGIHCAD